MRSGNSFRHVGKTIVSACCATIAVFSGNGAFAQYNSIADGHALRYGGPNVTGIIQQANVFRMNQPLSVNNLHASSPAAPLSNALLNNTMNQQRNAAQPVVQRAANTRAQGNRPSRAPRVVPSPAVVQAPQLALIQAVPPVAPQAMVQAFADNGGGNLNNDVNVAIRQEASPNVVASNVAATNSAATHASLSLPSFGRMRVASSARSSSARHSKGKTRHSFSYKFAKRTQQLFAKSRKGRFDPAKCFAWN